MKEKEVEVLALSIEKGPSHHIELLVVIDEVAKNTSAV